MGTFTIGTFGFLFCGHVTATEYSILTRVCHRTGDMSAPADRVVENFDGI